MSNKTINEITNVSTQANDDDLLIMWDKNREKTVKIKDKDFNKNNQPKTLETPIEVDNVEETTVEGALGAINDKVKNFTAGVAFKGTRSAYETAKLIPEGSDGHIPSGALVIITDEGRTYVTNGTGSSQTLELVANATFNGSHAEWNALTLAQKAMYNIVNFDDDEAIGLTISDVVQDGNMNPVTSNAVANHLVLDTINLGIITVEANSNYRITLSSYGIDTHNKQWIAFMWNRSDFTDFTLFGDGSNTLVLHNLLSSSVRSVAVIAVMHYGA